MSKQVNIHEAKTHFSKLIERALTGEEIIVAKAGKPLVKLVPVEPPQQDRVPGSAKGEIKILGDIVSPPPLEMWDAFRDDVKDSDI